MKQILLLTDGCSNVGVSPVVAAAQALAEGITVNVVGLLDEGDLGEHGAAEIQEIARAGGGLSRMVQTRELAQTVQMMTRKTVMNTIQHVVQQELRQVLGEGAALEALSPEKRSQVVRVMDELGESSTLQVALLIDASASMKPKLAAVEEAIQDLVLSLQARAGKSLISVFYFPGKRPDELCSKALGWLDAHQKLPALLRKLDMRGTTPTGPALLQVVDFYREDVYGRSIKAETDGMRSDDVV